MTVIIPMPVDLENAIHITSLRNLKYFAKGVYQRIYWGAEFCQNLIPTLGDTRGVLRFCRRKRLQFTFITPFVTERGIEKLRKVFSLLAKESVGSEIVINDWGALEWLHRKHKGKFSLSLGRLLVRQHRDPAIEGAIRKQPPLFSKFKDGSFIIAMHKQPPEIYRRWVKSSHLNAPATRKFLSGFNIRRAEFSNTFQGVNLRGVRLFKSLYTPFVNVSSTRFCPMDSRHQKLYRINVCARECQRYYDVLRREGKGVELLKRGNTLFYENPLKKDDSLLADVDRIVFQPELPL